MTLQWTLVAVFLHTEMVLTVLLMLPFISATVWQKIFKSRFLKKLAAYSNFYFLAFIGVLLLLFLDSLRQLSKYSAHEHEHNHHEHYDVELQRNMKVFRAQRNCYISGFALFLAPVIYRLASLLSKQATLIASSEASLKQAKSATDMAEKLMKEKEMGDNSEIKDNDGNALRVAEKEVKEFKEKYEEAVKELKATKLNLDTVKSQAEGTSREYDRLLAEHEKLQNEVAKAAGSGDKKEE